jgi:hypothetical protein
MSQTRGVSLDPRTHRLGQRVILEGWGESGHPLSPIPHKAGKPRRTCLDLDEVRCRARRPPGNTVPSWRNDDLGGLRIGELCNLRWRDVDLARGMLTVAESKTDAGERAVARSPAGQTIEHVHVHAIPDALATILIPAGAYAG